MTMNESSTILLKSFWDHINIGDMGHAPGTLRVLEQYLPQARVILWVSQLEDALHELLQTRFPKVEVVQGSANREGELDSLPLEKAFDRADLLLQNSSMGEEIGMMRAARNRGMPYGLFAQSYFPDIADRNPELIDLLHDASFVYCRDTLTRDTLRHANVRAPVVAFNPDGCFGYDQRQDATAFLTEHGLEPRKFITVHLRTNTQKHPGTDSFLNPANPTPQQIADDERRAAIFRGLITLWVQQTGQKVLIAPEVKKELAHNKRLVVDRLPEEIRRHVVVPEGFWSTPEAASVFADAHTVVCHEPHSCIFALANGTPILHTYSAFHSPKYHMFADVGVPEWLLPLDELTAEQIVAQLMAIDADYPAAQAKVQNAMHVVRSCFNNTCQVIGEAMTSASRVS